MGLRPFPYQLGIGTDIVHVTRIRAILQKDQSKPGYLDRFLRRFLTPLERIDFYKTQDSLSGVQFDASSKHLAGRWAAKEAVIKAVSWRRLSFHDIIIQRATSGGGVLAVILDRTSNMRLPINHNATISSQTTGTDMKSGGALYSWTNSRRAGLRGGFIEDNLDGLDESTKLAEQDPPDSDISSYDVRTDWDSDLSAARDAPGQIAKLSISHDGEYATAVCLAANQPFNGKSSGETAAHEII